MVFSFCFFKNKTLNAVSRLFEITFLNPQRCKPAWQYLNIPFFWFKFEGVFSYKTRRTTKKRNIDARRGAFLFEAKLGARFAVRNVSIWAFFLGFLRFLRGFFGVSSGRLPAVARCPSWPSVAPSLALGGAGGFLPSRAPRAPRRRLLVHRAQQ